MKPPQNFLASMKLIEREIALTNFLCVEKHQAFSCFFLNCVGVWLTYYFNATFLIRKSSCGGKTRTLLILPRQVLSPHL
jgi:hypothetical protein